MLYSVCVCVQCVHSRLGRGLILRREATPKRNRPLYFFHLSRPTQSAMNADEGGRLPRLAATVHQSSIPAHQSTCLDLLNCAPAPILARIARNGQQRSPVQVGGAFKLGRREGL